MRFKIGDKVKIIANAGGHNYPLGSIVKIAYSTDPYYQGIIIKTGFRGNNFLEADCKTYDEKYVTQLEEMFLNEEAILMKKAGMVRIEIELTDEGETMLMANIFKANKESLLRQIDKEIAKKK